jgi:hypothetical protein
MDLAAQAKASIPQGKVLAGRRLNQLAGSIETSIFACGGLSTVQSVIEKLLARPRVKLVLPDADPSDDLKSHMVAAAKDFFTNIMNTKGRRSSMDTNVFWGVLAAILPESIVHDRKQREAARMLGVDAAVIKKGIEYRMDLSDGWKTIVTSAHCDQVDWLPMVEWIHNEGSTVDNDHKEMVEVNVTNTETGEVAIENHPRKYPDDTRIALLSKFKNSATFEAMQASFQQKEEEKRLKKATRTVKQNTRNINCTLSLLFLDNSTISYTPYHRRLYKMRSTLS